jgi:alpha-beta hydrolase superfamily lysophospholipase
MPRDHIPPPSALLQMLEARALPEASLLMAQLPLLRLQAPKGDGRTVMVLPGYMTTDASTWLLRRFLADIGYRAQGWGLGINRGPALSFLPKLEARVEAVVRDEGRPVDLVGWSRGGTLSREIARDRPELVRQVITLGSPVRGGPSATSINRFVQMETGKSAEFMRDAMRERNKTPITVPITAIYSKSDGVVAWQAAIDDHNPQVDHIEVQGSHAGLGWNAQVYRLLAKRLNEPPAVD